jgi:sulfur-oxidizing protein SoxY
VACRFDPDRRSRRRLYRAQRGAHPAGWEEHIGEVLGGRYPRGDFSRLRLQVAHPMDNGMVSGIPEFFINHAELRRDGQRLASLELFPAVSENPNLAFDIEGQGRPPGVARQQRQ